MTQPTTPPEQQLTLEQSRKKIELWLANEDNAPGDGYLDIAERYIKAQKLQFLIVRENNKWVLKNQFTPGELHLQKFITQHQQTLVMKQEAKLISETDYEVLICGETGTGKEIIAKSMIANRQGVVVAVNCAGLPEQLIEAELFGYKKGAFTGAETDRNGLIKAAENGVMFLDEIGEMPLPAQAKLLRVMQEKVMRKVGSTVSEPVNCKFVFATHRDLRKMVQEGSFRKDLYARISTLELNILPLWPERKCDIIPIVESLVGGQKFLEKYRELIVSGALDLSLNCRSLQQYVTRYTVLGNIVVP